MPVDRTEHLSGGIGIEESAGAIVDSLAADRHIVGVHYAMDKAQVHPLGDQHRLRLAYGIQQGERAIAFAQPLREMPLQGIVGQVLDRFTPLVRGSPFESADAQVAGGDAGQDCPRLRRFAPYSLAGQDHGQTARGRHSQRCHGFGNQVFAQRRTKGALAIALPGKRRRPGTLELQIQPRAIRRHHFAQQERAAIAKLRIEIAKLVARIGQRQRLRPGQFLRTGKPLRQLLLSRSRQADRLRQGRVPHGHARRGRLGRLPRHVEPIQLARQTVIEVQHQAEIFSSDRALIQ